LAVSSRIKDVLNWCLTPLNLTIQTRTAEKRELARLLALAECGQFERRIFPLLPQFVSCNPAPIFEAVKLYRPETERFARLPEENGYSFHNDYFFPPDAQVAYAMARTLKPKRIVEVGSGNSTWLFRQAIMDGGLETEIYSIDPHPRRAIEASVKVIKEPVEDVAPEFFFETLREGDFLFIDSSHEVKVGNDVLYLFLNILPGLPPGIVVHIHDIFLPFDYPKTWIIDDHRHRFGEQYLAQAMLADSGRYEVIWPGRYLQLTQEDFAAKFACSVPLREATSLWLRVRSPES
jgi:predicted O-methyltransferase YrrM